MERVLSTRLEGIHESSAVQSRRVAHSRSNGNSWVLIGCLLGWLGMGGFLAWLIGDFRQAYGEPDSRGISLLIFSMFVMSAFVVALVRLSPRQARSSARV